MKKVMKFKRFRKLLSHIFEKTFSYLKFITLIFVFCFSACNAPTPSKLNGEQIYGVHSNEFSNVLETLCQSKIVLLGEGPTHGEGTTLAYKANIVESLISDCGFELLLFEASFYEFAKLYEIKGSGAGISREKISTALGFVYRDKVQLQSLVDFINYEMKTGSLSLGGLDYQPGGRGQEYSNYGMLDEIIASQSIGGRSKCNADLKQRILYNFPKDAPYNVQKKEKLLNCLVQQSNQHEPITSDLSDMMRINLYQFIDRDFSSGRERMAGRSAFMYENFKFWIELFEVPPKTIVWASSAHTSKSSEISPAFENIPNFGSLVKEEFGDSVYSLGFSSLKGAVRTMPGDIVDLPLAPENSIEVMVFSTTKDDMAFLDASALSKLGTRPGAAVYNMYQERDWSTIFDGIVVFREQKPALKR